MQYKLEYKNDDERTNIFSTYKDKILIEEANITEGNFLIFSDEALDPRTDAQKISDLEDQLLLMADSQVGGIL